MTKPSSNGHVRKDSENVHHIPEEHRPKFRGTFAPAELHELLYDGRITSTEFALLQIIDSLVDSRGDGCWASNAFLARMICKSIDHVKTMVKKLKEIDLLRQVGWKRVRNKDYRILETAWSRVDRGGATGCYDGDRGGAHATPTGGAHTTQIKRKKPEKTHGRSQAHDGARSALFSDDDKSTEFKGTRFDRECSDKLYQAIEEFIARRGKGKMRRMPRKALGPAQFALLRKELDQDKARITTVLDWYCIHLGDQYVTTALCAKSFRERFDDIEIQMERSQRPKRSKTNGNGYDHSHDPNRLQPWEMEIDPRENELQPWEMGIDPRFNQIDENGR